MRGKRAGPENSSRGQTIHDYLIGVVIVILTLGVAIGLLGNAYDPFFDPVDSEDETFASEIADELIAETQTDTGAQTVNELAIKDKISTDLSSIRDSVGVPDWRTVNVSIETISDGTVSASGGEPREDGAEATAVRMIQSPVGDCDGGCQLIVRVW